MAVYRRLADFLERQPMPFHVWVRRTAYEQLLALRRQHLGADKRAVGREVALPDRSSLLLAQRLVGKASTPSRQLERRELARQVRRVLLELPDLDRELLFLRTFEGLPYAEAADILGIEPAAARKRYGRALVRLQQLLADGGLTEPQA